MSTTPELARTQLRRDSWLDFCRSLAILTVLLSHGRHFLTPVWESTALFRIGGYLGVELFFVLSGFLVGRILLRGFLQGGAARHWLPSFLARRWLRTLPLFYLFLLINALLIACHLAPGSTRHLLPFLWFGQNFAWSGPAEFGEAWSLSVEEVFYLLFPVGLLIVNQFVPRREGVFIVVMITLLLVPMVLRILLVYHTSPSWDEGVRKVVLFRLDALMTGVLIGWWIERRPAIWSTLQPVLSTLAIVFIGFVVFLYFHLEATRDIDLFYRTLLFTVTSVGFALLILAGYGSVNLPPWLDSACTHMARWSYVLYLCHMPVIYLVNRLYGAPIRGDVPGAIVRWLSFFLVSIVTAIVLERLIERPILSWRDRTFSR